MLNLPLNPHDPFSEALYQYAIMHRGCIPGVIVGVDSPQGSTVSVQPALSDPIIDENGVRQDTALETIPHVPLAVLAAGGFAITFPVAEDDECLLIFQDMCIDGAWQSGGTDNLQLDKRRHDLRDPICLPVSWTQPSQISDTSDSSLQIRSLDGSTVIDIADGVVTVTAGSVKLGNGTLQTLVTNTWLTYWNTTVRPALATAGIVVVAPPANAATTNTEAS